MRRFGAFIIDMVIILIISNLIGCILPNYGKINALSVEFSDILVEYMDAISNEDEEEIESLNAIIYDYNYESAKLSVINKIVLVVLYFLYFVLFQCCNNGQTLGKKLFKIRVVDSNNKKLSLKQMFIRSSIIYPIVFNLIVLLVLFIGSEDLYLNFSSIVILFRYALFIICCFMAIFMNRGLHDIFSHTIVVLSNEEFDNDTESMADKWKNNNNKEQVIKKYHHTTGKIKN